MAVETPRDPAGVKQGLTLRDGASVRVRAIRPDDEPRLMALCRRLSSRTVYQRFFSVRRLLPEEAHAFANVDYRQRMAVVAEVDGGQEPELVGVARYGPSDEGTADIGLVVADGSQGLGLGSFLLEEILRAGELRGIHEFSADVLMDNAARSACSPGGRRSRGGRPATASSASRSVAAWTKEAVLHGRQQAMAWRPLAWEGQRHPWTARFKVLTP